MLKRLYKRAFDIRDGEITISFFMQLYIFLVITVLLIVKPTVNALFLSALGAERLPYGYLMVAVVAVLSSYFYTTALKKYSFKKIATLTLITFSLFFVILSIALHYRFLEQWVLYFYYVLISLFAVIVTSQFWILANMVYNAREAKRLFGFIGAGAIAGGIFGGYLTTFISSNFGNKISILIAAIFIIACIPILSHIWKLRLKELSVYARRKKLHEKSSPDKNAFQLIIKSNHLLFLALIIGVSVVVAKLVDFQFSDFAHRAIPDSDELASFLGFWFSSFNVIALLIQLFVTNKVLSYLGVTSTMLILPLGIALGCLLFLTVPELWVLIIIKGLDGSFKQSINKAAAELSILPIPYPIKNQAKSFIDIVVDSVATGLAGCLLIFVIKGMELDTTYVTILILFFLFIWLILIYKLRDAYFESFRSNLQSLLYNDASSRRKLQKEGTITSARKILQNGSEEEILTLLNRLSNARLKPLRPQILSLLHHESPKIQIAILEQLYFYQENTALEKVKTLLVSDNDEVVYRALQYLLHHTKIADDTLFNSYLNHPNQKISSAALLCLAEDSRSNSKLAQKFELRNRIRNQIDSLSTPEGLKNVQDTSELLLTIGNSGIKDYYYFISVHFNNKNTKVIKSAIKAAGITTDPLFIGHLLQFLDDKKVRKVAIKSLSMYGPEINKTILRLDTEELLSTEVRRYLPKVVATFKTQSSVGILYKFLSSKDVITRRRASKSIKKLLLENPILSIDKRKITRHILRESTYYQTTINAIATFNDLINKSTIHNITHNQQDLLVARESIVSLLRNQLDASLESIFALLSLRYNQEDISAAYYGLKSDTAEAKINAIEFLDNLLHIKLKSKILPLLEFNIIDATRTDTASYELEIIPENDIIKILLNKRSKPMKVAMLHLIKIKNDKQYIPVISYLKKHKDPKLRSLALHVLETLGS
ncbi:Npt1/Npt2 family nucleotide transporter [Dokdonia sp. Hel_I_53]|uniref:Npt1/Npt2 family nucleotide transporter n=1 Tax=Dokdonia sp. Hel_I_53 TaxID=1566287 RepID=UPI00119B6A3A|nr:Npt1/Npt2 family nucleotide transporter [Dokdonia sp. Hel_I_53]TVZ51301.1 AAA family ATP:ADP antiporter [Dokdonia sp. Hel_I_53]